MTSCDTPASRETERRGREKKNDEPRMTTIERDDLIPLTAGQSGTGTWYRQNVSLSLSHSGPSTAGDAKHSNAGAVNDKTSKRDSCALEVEFDAATTRKVG
jgi:hypothetical protein